MADYPTLTSGRSFLAPLVRITRYSVKVLTFADGSEQRFRIGPPLERFALKHEGITTEDRDLLADFFAARKGDYEQFSLVMNGTTYNYMKFESPDFTATQRQDHLWDVTLSLRQWRKN